MKKMYFAQPTNPGEALKEPGNNSAVRLDTVEGIELKAECGSSVSDDYVPLEYQRAFAEFGEFALWSDSLDKILHQACQLVSAASDTSLAAILELQKDGKTMLVRAGVGWAPGIVGMTRIPATGSTAKPVILSDIRENDQYKYLGCLLDHDVRALAIVPILRPDHEPPYGILQVACRTPRAFTRADTLFLRSYANLVAAAIERLRSWTQLREYAEEKERLLTEMQHEATSNLRIVTALVDQVASYAKHVEATDAAHAVSDGIEAAGFADQDVHPEDKKMQRICLGTYLSEVVAGLLSMHNDTALQKISLISDMSYPSVSSSVGVALGLITGQFMSDTLRYIFANEKGGIIKLKMEVTSNLLQLTLSEDGNGYRGEIARRSGIKLIERLASQIKATCQWSGETGTQLMLSMQI